MRDDHFVLNKDFFNHFPLIRFRHQHLQECNQDFQEALDPLKAAFHSTEYFLLMAAVRALRFHSETLRSHWPEEC